MASKKFNYNHILIKELDDSLKCCFCLELVKGQPKQHDASGCSGLFCKECLEQHGNNPCPVCGGQHPHYIEDVKSFTDIRALGVKCINVDRGCKWKGTVDTLEKHVDTCDLTMVDCPNKCKVKGNFASFQRKDLPKHLTNNCPLRKYQCKYCRDESTYFKIMNEHDKICAKKPITCPNEDCGQTIEQGQLQTHLNRCQHTVVWCKYNHIGCKVKGKRKDFDIIRHEADYEAHSNILLDAVADMIPTYKEEVIVLRRKISELEQQLEVQSDTIAKLKIENVPAETLQQKIEANSKATDALKEEMNTIKGVTIVDLEGYTHIKTENIIYRSKSFYTYFSGHRMCLVVNVNGDDVGKNSHVSVYVEMVEVPYKLKLPFKGWIKFELLNRIADENHWARVIDTDSDHDNKFSKVGGQLGCSRFIPQEKLQYKPGDKVNYLKKDTLRFRVTVQEDNKPWLKPELGHK